MSFVKISTTGTLSPVIIDDLGAFPFIHPTVDFVIWDSADNSPFTFEEVRESINLQEAIDNGHITMCDQNGNNITNIFEQVPLNAIHVYNGPGLNGLVPDADTAEGYLNESGVWVDLDADLLSINNDLSILKTNEKVITYYEVVSAASSGNTVNAPVSSTILLDKFGASKDAILSKVDVNDNPTWETPLNGSSEEITVALTAGGVYTFSETPVDSDVAVIYIFKIKEEDYPNVDIDFIISEDEIARELVQANWDATIGAASILNKPTITTFGESLIDDADATEARATLGVDIAGTDNSTNVTLDTDLDTTEQAANIVGQELELLKATPSTDGVMSSEDKTKLDAIEVNAKDDQDASEVPFTPTGNTTSTNVQDAIVELQTELDSQTDDQQASEVTYNNTTSGLTATDTQAAIDELDSTIDGLGTSSHAAVTLAGDSTTTDTVDLSGQEITVNLVTLSTDGAMSSSDKTKLDAITGTNTGDETLSTIQAKRPLKTIEGQSLEGSGNIDLDKTDVGLSNVPNTDFTSAVALNTAKETNVDTNLSIANKTATTLDVVSSDGTDATIPAATPTEAGLHSAADKTKLNTIETNAKDDQNASEVPFTPSGDIIATDVQAAIQEVRDDADTKLSTKIDLSEKGAANGVATLDGSGQVPASQLPSYVDDVIEVANFASLPGTGETGKIYVTLDNNLTYRWTGSVYVEVGSNDVNSVNGETGIVVLTTGDIAEDTNKNYVTDSDVTNLGNLSGNNSGDQNASQVPFTPNGDISSTDTQSAIEELRNDTDTKLSGKSDTSHTHDWDEATGTADVIPFNTSFTKPAHTEGLYYYDKDEKAFVGYIDEADVTQQLGREIYRRVRNESGATITNGQAVYQNAVQVGGESRPLIELAKADVELTSSVLGLATHDIENNTYGYVTIIGDVNDIDTSSFVAGCVLYLSPTTAGALTHTRPDGDDYIVKVGIAEIVNATTGRINVGVNNFGSITDSNAIGGLSYVIGDGGLSVVENDPEDQTVDYTGGNYIINGVQYNIASGGNFDFQSPTDFYATMNDYQRRLVTLYVDSTMTLKAIAGPIGEKEDALTVPALPADSLCIAVVELRVNGSGDPKDIKDNYHITDCRMGAEIPVGDEFVKVSADDTDRKYLEDAFTDNGNVTFTKENTGANETLKADVDLSGYSLTSHTHTASDVTDFDTEVSNNTSVTANTSKVSFPEAPQDGNQYARKDAGWEQVSGVDSVFEYIGFDYLQESSVTAVVKSADVNTWYHFNIMKDLISVGSGFTRTKFAINDFISTSSFRVAGDVTARFADDCSFRISGSTNNDGIYTVNNSSFGTTYTTININQNTLSTTPDDGYLMTDEWIVTADGASSGYLDLHSSVDGNNFGFEIGIFKNGSLVETAYCHSHMISNSEPQQLAIELPIAVATNDVIDLRHRVTTGTNKEAFLWSAQVEMDKK